MFLNLESVLVPVLVKYAKEGTEEWRLAQYASEYVRWKNGKLIVQSYCPYGLHINKEALDKELQEVFTKAVKDKLDTVTVAVLAACRVLDSQDVDHARLLVPEEVNTFLSKYCGLDLLFGMPLSGTRLDKMLVLSSAAYGRYVEVELSS
ncbi:MAG: hypothetical protein A2Z21_01945 [Candidatus Fraserbacteria bacterium RBG_16_55_9]|uniref:Uncharacterized protein n=1 Tax=Fraserbacteria sp. (strain RBG_16_55_9) TaxID=1817864 RepID=A0A1F5UP29_FRAXR|nr:MAG: hypothetical protein A2Z21_01945 [Candidatus Fraserbacteria bacterium RBG_16_55_9]